MVGSVSGSWWHLCSQSAVLRRALLHRVPLGHPGQPARLRTCHKQGFLRLSRLVTLLTVIITSWLCSRHMSPDMHVCVYFEFCYFCFSHALFRTVIAKTLSFFLTYRALVIFIVHILQVLQCGFLGTAFDTHHRASILP